jgi:hypothetical protein
MRSSFGFSALSSAAVVMVTAGFGGGGLAVAADPWADRVISFDPGTGSAAGYSSSDSALGSPTRFTSPSSPFGGVVTPFNPAFGNDELFSIGAGGSITVAFNEPIQNNPNNPFGLDLIIFGNAGFIDDGFSAPGATPGTVRADSALFGRGRTPVVQVSQDGHAWFTVPGRPDGLFPTLAYSDVEGPYTSTLGAVPTDYTKPVNPALDPSGMTFAQLLSAYDGSGGGTGIDIASSGLSEISFVRVFNSESSSGAFEIDGFAAVTAIPTPSALAVVLSGALWSARRRRSL